jgi:hypothetical protein
MITLQIYSLSKFQVQNATLSTMVAMKYVRSPFHDAKGNDDSTDNSWDSFGKQNSELPHHTWK